MPTQKDLKTFAQLARDIVLLRMPSVRKVVRDKNMFKPALVIVALGSFVSSLGYVFFPVTYGDVLVYRYDLAWVLMASVGGFLMTIATFYFTGFLGEYLFKSKLDMQGYVRVMGFASILNLLMIIPPLSTVVGVWMFVILWRVFRELGKLEPLPILGLILLAALFGTALGWGGIFRFIYL